MLGKKLILFISLITSVLLMLLFQNCDNKLVATGVINNTSSNIGPGGKETPIDPSEESAINLEPYGPGSNKFGPIIRLAFFSELSNNEKFFITWDNVSQHLIKIDIESGLRTIIASTTVGVGPLIVSPTGYVFTKNDDFLYVSGAVAGNLNVLVKINLTTHERTIVSDENTGSGEGLGTNFFGRLVITNDASKVYAYLDSLKAILEIDLINGNRRLVSSSSIGIGDSLVYVYSASLSSDSTELWVVDSLSESSGARVVKVNLSTGDRTVVDNYPNQTDDRYFHLNAASLELFLLSNNSLVKVDLQNGNRVIIASNNVGSGPKFFNSAIINHKEKSNSLFALHRYNYSLIKVNLQNMERTLVSSSKIGEGPYLDYTLGAYLNGDENQVMMFESAIQSFMKIDLISREKTIVSGSGRGQGPSLIGLRSFAVNDEQSTGYIYYQDSKFSPAKGSVVKVDLASGDRSVVSSEAFGSGANIDSGSEIVINKSESMAYILGTDAQYNGEIISVDLVTGNRSVVANTSTGTGEIFRTHSISLDNAENFAYVINREKIIQVNLSNGNRTIVTSNTLGTGDFLVDARNITVGADDNFVYVTDSNSLFKIEISTGNRSMITSAVVGAGPVLRFPYRFAVNKNSTEAFISDNGLFRVDLVTGNRMIWAR